MNPRCPTVTLSVTESARLVVLVRERGEREAVAVVGLSTPRTFYRAACGLPVSRLTAQVIRHSLDRI
jgi:hypothetical protein